MNADDNSQGTPKPDLGRAPFGHADDRPLSAQQPADLEAPPVDLLANGVTHAHEALGSFEHHEAPMFAPSNITLASPGAESFAQRPQASIRGSDSPDSQIPGIRAFVRRNPVAAVLAAAALGALLARLSR